MFRAFLDRRRAIAVPELTEGDLEPQEVTRPLTARSSLDSSTFLTEKKSGPSIRQRKICRNLSPPIGNSLK